jgi:hypothetical protein
MKRGTKLEQESIGSCSKSIFYYYLSHKAIKVDRVTKQDYWWLILELTLERHIKIKNGTYPFFLR